MNYQPFNLGVTLYSFNVEFYSYKFTLESALELISRELGVGQGVEYVAPMHDREFPHLSKEMEHRLRNALEKYELVPVCYSGYSDPQRIRGRFLTDDEEFAYVKLQLDAAKKLGFPLARVGARDRLIPRLAEYCEKIGIKMGSEIHAPRMIETIKDKLAAIKATGSDKIGIVPDCGTFCRKPSEVFLRKFTEQGVEKKYQDEILKLWQQKTSIPDGEKAIKAMGGGELELLMATESAEYFGHSDPASMTEVMPYIFHVHGKFFHVNEQGEEDAVRFPEIVAALQEGGFEGYMVSEYEGHHWYPGYDPMEQIKRHQKMIRSLMK